MTQPKNSPTEDDDKEINVCSTGETVRVERPDLETILELELKSDGDEPRWELTASFTKLETAIRFIQKAWGRMWLLSTTGEALRSRGPKVPRTF